MAGVAFGGIRILMKRWYPDKVFDRPEQMEFISLHLTETVGKGAVPEGRRAGRQALAKSVLIRVSAFRKIGLRALQRAYLSQIATLRGSVN